MSGEPSIANCIPTVGCMLTTVNLDHQPPFPANEIHDEWPYRFLPYKLQAVKRSRAKVLPQQLFGGGRVPTKASY